MSGELREAIRGVRERVEATDRVVAERGERTDVLAQLTGADYISLAALFVGWGSALLFLRGEPNWALLVMFGAFALDKLDGWYARRAAATSVEATPRCRWSGATYTRRRYAPSNESARSSGAIRWVASSE